MNDYYLRREQMIPPQLRKPEPTEGHSKFVMVCVLGAYALIIIGVIYAGLMYMKWLPFH